MTWNPSNQPVWASWALNVNAEAGDGPTALDSILNGYLEYIKIIKIYTEVLKYIFEPGKKPDQGLDARSGSPRSIPIPVC